MYAIRSYYVHTGEAGDPFGAVHPPVYQSTTFRFASTADLLETVEGGHRGALYTRYGMNPTILALEEKLRITSYNVCYTKLLRINGGFGNDLLNGGAGHDVLNGDDGDDTIFGGADADTLDGGDGDDKLNAQGGEDSLIGVV